MRDGDDCERECCALHPIFLQDGRGYTRGQSGDSDKEGTAMHPCCPPKCCAMPSGLRDIAAPVLQSGFQPASSMVKCYILVLGGSAGPLSRHACQLIMRMAADFQRLADWHDLGSTLEPICGFTTRPEMAVGRTRRGCVCVIRDHRTATPKPTVRRLRVSACNSLALLDASYGTPGPATVAHWTARTRAPGLHGRSVEGL